MFRLTLVLLVGLYATMAIWGEPTGSDVAVSRDATLPSSLPSLGAAPAAAEAEPAQGSTLADVSEKEAVEMALAAGEKKPEAATPAVAPQEEPEDLVERWYVTGSRVNLRSGPSTGAAIVGGLSLGDRAEILSDPNDQWIRIRTEEGLEAWIYGRFLSETPA